MFTDKLIPVCHSKMTASLYPASKRQIGRIVIFVINLGLCSSQLSAAPKDPLLPLHFQNHLTPCLKVTPGSLIIADKVLSLEVAIKPQKSIGHCGCKSATGGYLVEKVAAAGPSQWQQGVFSSLVEGKYVFVLDRNFATKESLPEYALSIGCAPPE